MAAALPLRFWRVQEFPRSSWKNRLCTSTICAANESRHGASLTEGPGLYDALIAGGGHHLSMSDSALFANDGPPARFARRSETATRRRRLEVREPVLAVRIHLAPPPSPSVFALIVESLEKGELEKGVAAMERAVESLKRHGT